MNLEFSNKDEVTAVLNSFRELYKEKKTYRNISITEIAQKSGVTLGHIYSNFQSKDDITLSLIKKDIHDIFITFDEEVDASLTMSDKFKIFLSLQFEFLGPDYKLIKELLPYGFIPFSQFSNFANDTRKRYLDFISELINTDSPKLNPLIKMIKVPAIANSLLAFNLAVLRYWGTDKSEGKQHTLNYIDKGVKNIMIASAML